ncbi:hypothetical protein Pfo_031082 [Paulownia fortunei]|nr:hypothetical protein Pfo_031082 [Paulownia fortunei]
MDLRKTSLKFKNSKEVLQELSNKAERTIMEFKREVKDPLMENPLNWPVKVVAANSMYSTSRTILLSCEGENEQTDEGLFERLSVMIADIWAACLTNLARVITTIVLQILELLQQHEWPSLDHDKAAHIEEWRAFFCQDKDDPAASPSTSSNETVTTPVSSDEHLAITKLEMEHLHGVGSSKSNIQKGSKSGDATELDLSPYVLLHEGETEQPEGTLNSICHQVDRLIQAAIKESHVAVAVHQGSFQCSGQDCLMITEILIPCDQDREESSSKFDVSGSTMGMT